MPGTKSILRILSVAFGLLVGVALAAMLGGVYFYNLSRSLPDLDRVQPAEVAPQNSIVYAADGSVIAEWHGEQNRRVVESRDIPQRLKDAVVAIEDRRFYEHRGVDWPAMLRAARANAAAGRVRQGGSTITQQLVKLLFTTGERTFDRKIREALLAYELETHIDKDAVLAAYLNTVYFGNGAYGVESAARRYFGTSASELTLSQCALLAGVVRSPSGYDPVARPDNARQRRDLVLSQMREQGYIDAREERLAADEEPRIAPSRDVAQVAPYFVEYVKTYLIDRLGAERVYGGGLRVYTTLEPEIQRAAERAAKILPSSADPSVAIVALRHTDGAILAMVGGRDYASSQFNLAAQGRRQPGSAFKPFVLVAALEDGVKPDQTFSTAPYSVPVKDGIWRVQNYENTRTNESVTLHAATNWSVNAVYARLIMKVGPQHVVDVAKKMGIASPLEPDPAIALGGLRRGVTPLEMASAYGTVANWGSRVEPSAVQRVTDETGRLVVKCSPAREQVLDKQVAVEAGLMLHEVIERGTGGGASFGKWAAGKTGTTQSYRDAWFVGWSEGVSTAVWVGYPEAQVAMTNVHGVKVTGGSYPARIWGQFMREAVKIRSKAVTTTQPARPPDPGAQVKVVICKASMKLATERCKDTVGIWLAPRLVPKEACTPHQ